MKTVFVGLALVFMLNTPVLAARFHCRGEKLDKTIFTYDVESIYRGLMRVRLMTYKNDRLLKDHGWKQARAPYGKFEVASPWKEYRTYLTPLETVLDLVVVEPLTDTQIEPGPFRSFYCYKMLP